jgi:hypothetical protein
MYNSVYTGDLQDKRFFGIYRGLVADTEDPLGVQRLKLLVPQIFGEAITEWAWSIQGKSTSYAPQLGEGVWVMFEGGDPNFPLWIGSF